MTQGTFSAYPNNTASSWWKDPGLKKNVFFCIGCCLCPYYLGYDQSLLTGVQSLPQWTKYFDSPAGNWLGLITMTLFLPPIFLAPFADMACQRYGRRWIIWIGSVIIIAGALWNGLCTSIGQYMGARTLIGLGGTLTKVAAPALLHELAHPRLRGTLGVMYYGFYYTGSLTSACMCIAGLHVKGNWGWRLPVIFQAFGPILVILITLGIPESPRWLISRGRNEEAMAIMTKYHANGMQDDPLVNWEYAEIVETLKMEMEGHKTRYIDFIKTPGNRRRLLIIVATSFGGNWVGNGIVSYYLTPVLKQLGVTNPTNLTAVNAGLAVWNLILAETAALNMERVGRRPMFLISTGGMIASYAIVMACSATYAKSVPKNIHAGTAAIPFLFFFYGFYDIAWTPLGYAYTCEVTPYHMRTKGLAIYTISQNASNAFNQFVNPIALAKLTWKYYGVYIALDCFWFALIYFYFPETKKLSIEEISLIMDYGRLGVGREQVHADLERAIAQDKTLEHPERDDEKTRGEIAHVEEPVHT